MQEHAGRYRFIGFADAVVVSAGFSNGDSSSNFPNGRVAAAGGLRRFQCLLCPSVPCGTVQIVDTDASALAERDGLLEESPENNANKYPETKRYQ
jgi:hypothetical protein